MKIAISFLILLLLLLLILLPGSDLPNENIQENTSYIENVQLRHIKNGITEWSAKILSASLEPATNLASLKDVNFTFSSQKMDIFADTGTYNLSTDDLILEGHVRAASDNVTIKLDSISWSSSRSELSSDSRIFVDGGTFTVRGRGLHINTDGEIQIKEDAKAVITF